MPYCPKCGRKNDDGSKFCDKCGAKLPSKEGPSEGSHEQKKDSPTPKVPAKGGSIASVLAGKKALVIAVATALVTIAVGIGVINVTRQGNSSSPNDASASSSQTKTAQGDSSTQEANDTQEADAKKKAEEEAAAKKKAEEEAAAKKKAEEEAAKHEALKNEALANGEQVFEGTVVYCTGTEAADLLGTQDMLRGLPAGSEENTLYALLQFDGAQEMSVSVDPVMPVETRSYPYLCIGQNSSGVYSGSEDTASEWEQYNGQRVCVAASGIGMPGGVSIMNVPKTYQGTRLLYVVDGSGSAPAEATQTQAAQEESYDPTWYTATDTTFETQDFIVTVPDEWAGTWEMQGPHQSGDDVVWIFMRTVMPENGRPTPDGGGLIVTSSEGEPTGGTYAPMQPAADGASSHGKHLWYVIGDPQGFFSINGENAATVKLK